MSNFMAEDMRRRFVSHLYSNNHDVDAVNTLYYWVMSTLESCFWSDRNPSIFADLYASKDQMFLVFWDSFGNELEYKFIPAYTTSDIDLKAILDKFIELFNDVIYSSSFKASYLGIWNNPFNRSKFYGYHHVSISVYMITDEKEDLTNRGING